MGAKCPTCGRATPGPKRLNREKTVREAMFIALHGVPLEWRYRRNDPLASELSAKYEGTFRPSIRAILFAALIVHGPLTAREACEKIGCDPWQGSKRFSELVTMGIAEGTGEIVESKLGGKAEKYRAAVEPQHELPL